MLDSKIRLIIHFFRSKKQGGLFPGKTTITIYLTAALVKTEPVRRPRLQQTIKQAAQPLLISHCPLEQSRWPCSRAAVVLFLTGQPYHGEEPAVCSRHRKRSPSNDASADSDPFHVEVISRIQNQRRKGYRINWGGGLLHLYIESFCR